LCDCVAKHKPLIYAASQVPAKHEDLKSPELLNTTEEVVEEESYGSMASSMLSCPSGPEGESQTEHEESFSTSQVLSMKEEKESSDQSGENLMLLFHYYIPAKFLS